MSVTPPAQPSQPETVASILEQAQNPENPPAHRARVVEELWDHTTAESAEEVETVLCSILRQDDNAIVRHEAAFVLGKLYDEGTIEGKLALDALTESCRNDPSVVVRHESAEGLGVFATPKAIETLQILLTDEIPDVVETAKIALADIEYLQQMEGQES